MGIGAAANPASISMDFNAADTYQGTAPSGSVNATFTDVPGGVKLILTPHLNSLQGITANYMVFNFNPTKEIAAIVATRSSPGMPGFALRATPDADRATVSFFSADQMRVETISLARMVCVRLTGIAQQS
jgi:hypothetical protein